MIFRCYRYKSTEFQLFLKYCRWDSEHNQEIQLICKRKCSDIIRLSLADIRRGKSAGKWMSSTVREALQHRWDTDSHFKQLSEQNKKNIATNKDGFVNRGGAISISEHKRRHGLELGREATIPEVYHKLNYDEKTGKWTNSKAEIFYGTYEKLKKSKISQGETELDESALFYEANRGNYKRGKSCGFGSEATFYCSSGLKSKATQYIDIKKLCDRMSTIEERLESELTSIRSLLEKLTGVSRPSSSHDASSSRVQPAVHDGDFGNGPNGMLNDANADFGVDEDVGNDDDYGDC